MTYLTVSSASTAIPLAMDGSTPVASSRARSTPLCQPIDKQPEPIDSPCCSDAEDPLHPFFEAMQDRQRMEDAFGQLADTLVPCLARVTVERPMILAQDFDFRCDKGRLRIVDTNMTPEDIAWLESRLNADPQLPELAAEFNESVVGAYGDTEHPYYWVQQGNAVWLEDAVPRLANTVDKDVKFMALLRTIRDADCGRGFEGQYFSAHRYALAPDKVKDFIMSPETYRKSPSGRVIAEPSKRSSRPSSAGWVA